MARWIDASPSQRFWQYTYPAAKRLIQSGDWDRCIADYDTQIATTQARVDAAEPGSHEHRRLARRLATLQDHRAGNIALRQADLDVIAKADRLRLARANAA